MHPEMSYDAYEYTVSLPASCPNLHADPPGRQRCSLCCLSMQVHSHTYDTAEIPAAKFTYDLSPVQILVSEKKRAWCEPATLSAQGHTHSAACGVLRPADAYASCLRALTWRACRRRYHFVTTTCAIIGGVFTVAGIVDGLIHTGTRFAKKVSGAVRARAPPSAGAAAPALGQ